MAIERITRRVLCTLLVAGLIASVSPAEEEQKGTASGEAVFGPLWFASDDPANSAKFSEYREVPNGFVLERFVFDWQPLPNFYLDLSARDVSELDQRIDLQLGNRGVWKFNFRHYQNPRLWTDGAHQLFTDKGGGVFTLDDTLQSAVQAAPATADANMDGEWDAGTKGALIKSAIGTSADDIDVGYRRRETGFGVHYTPTRNWTVEADASRERRGGNVPQSLGMYFTLQPAEVAAPVDFRTDWARVGAEYSSRKWNVGATAMASQFETGIDAITWDNQLYLTDVPSNANAASPGRGRLTPWSDSDMWKWVVYGGVNLPGRSRINVTVSQSETTQDDRFLPKTINSEINNNLNPAPLPARSLDGKYEETLGEIVFSTRPLRWFRAKAWYRNFDHDNKNPDLVFEDYVMTDYQFPTCGNVNACGNTANRIQRRSLPYSYERTNMGASFGFTPISWLAVTAGYEREEMDREYAAAEQIDEDIYKLALDFDVAEWLTIRTTGKHQERRADEYDAEYVLASFPIGEPYIAPANEGARKFIWTDRDRDEVSILFDASPSQILSIYAEYTYAKDDYLDPETGDRIGDSETVMEDRNFDSVLETYDIRLAGRVDDRTQTFTVGGVITPNDRFSIYGDHTWEEREYAMASRYRTISGGIGTDSPLDDWDSDAEDRYRTANLGFEAVLTADRKWGLRGNLSQSVGTGDITTSFVPGGNASGDTTLTRFPEVKTTLSIVQLALKRSVRKNLDLSLRYWFEKWDENNFASDFNRDYMGDPNNDPGSREAVYLGLDYDDYTNHIVGFLVRYRME